MKENSFYSVIGKFLVTIILFCIVQLAWSQATNTKSVSSSQVNHPDWSLNANIYEVNIRQYTPEGTFAAFEKSLPRLKKMGVDILWLMPINPIGIKNRKGTLGSYYSVKDYLGVNPEFGTLDDLKKLVKHAHDLGMHVIIDWVANHTSWDNNLIKNHPEWYTHDSTGKIIAPVPDWTDVADLDYSQKGLWKYMTDALIYWVKEADIDGYRCDVAGMIPVEFWNSAVPGIKKVKNVFMLAEWETPEMHTIAFDMTYSWDLFHLMNDIAKGTKTAGDIDSMLVKEKRDYPADAYRMRFTTNHDENSWNGTEFERMGEAAKTFAVLCYTLPGMPLIYSGQESAFNRRLKFFDKDTIDWNDYRLAGFYATLNKLKSGNSVLCNGSAGGKMMKVNTNNDKHIFAFLRIKDKNTMFVIINLSNISQKITLKGKSYSGDFLDLFTNEKSHFQEGEIMTMKPWEYKVYYDK